ncbi:MAG: SURF1 family protein [Aquihabitans sp.]
MSRYRFALKPKWILSHVFVLVMVLGMVRAGIWQWDRLQQRKEINARVEAVQQEEPASVDGLADPGDFAEGRKLEYRPVTATGTYLADQSVLVDGADHKGAAGAWVLTPLKLDNGDIVIVKRGTIPNPGQLDAVPASVETPTGEVTVEGLARPTETRPEVNLGFTKLHFERADPPSGTLRNMARTDLERLDQQIDGDVLPFAIALRTQDPKVTADEPLPPNAPDLSEGSHFSYTVQWFTFSFMTIVVYVLILRRRAREIEREALEAELDQADPDDAPVDGDPRIAPDAPTDAAT